MSKLTKILNILAIILISLNLLPLLCFGSLVGYSYYMNVNPDHVNLNDGTWKLVFSFKTIKKSQPILIYRKTTNKNDFAFVVVRKNILPFKLDAVSIIYKPQNPCWTKISPCKENTTSGIVHIFGLVLGPFPFDRYIYKPYPHIQIALYSSCESEELRLHYISYAFCDNIPVIDILHFNDYIYPPVFEKCNDFTIMEPNRLCE